MRNEVLHCKQEVLQRSDIKFVYDHKYSLDFTIY